MCVCVCVAIAIGSLCLDISGHGEGRDNFVSTGLLLILNCNIRGKLSVIRCKK